MVLLNTQTYHIILDETSFSIERPCPNPAHVGENLCKITLIFINNLEYNRKVRDEYAAMSNLNLKLALKNISQQCYQECGYKSEVFDNIIIHIESHYQNFRNQLRIDALEGKGDVLFIFPNEGNKTLSAHWDVLSAFEWFKPLECFKEGTKKTIRIDNFSSRTGELLLDYFYKSKITNVNVYEMLRFFQAADFLCLEECFAFLAPLIADEFSLCIKLILTYADMDHGLGHAPKFDEYLLTYFLERLGDVLENGTTIEGVTEEENEMLFSIFNTSLETNDPLVQAIKGQCYQLGFGVEKNLELAIQCYRLSAAQDHPIGLNNLGFLPSHRNRRCSIPYSWYSILSKGSEEKLRS